MAMFERKNFRVGVPSPLKKNCLRLPDAYFMGLGLQDALMVQVEISLIVL
jgi:hypothetical protein